MTKVLIYDEESGKMVPEEMLRKCPYCHSKQDHPSPNPDMAICGECGTIFATSKKSWRLNPNHELKALEIYLPGAAYPAITITAEYLKELLDAVYVGY